ncbi:MAG: two-component sensor histidine kinase, partial [Anaerolineae bacterium]|nr:two-component sensor histidine kinase [Anaerolineae bacterium]
VMLQLQQHGAEVALSVIDEGQGISPEHRPHLFERFYRVEASRSRQSGGRGLGLAIVKQIMDQHGGRVTVHSKLGQGSTFTLCWPAEL